MTDLRVAQNFALPMEVATQRLAIIGMSRSGKSSLAVQLAERMHAAGVPWVAVDPKGDWWGVRSNAAGDGPGLDVPVLGGLHADVPLEATAGKAVAELIVDQRLTCVLDVSEFDSRQDLFHLLADFGETLYRRNRAPLFLFLDEADEYLPQRPGDKGWGPKCLSVWQRLVRRGGFRGLGSAQITQRIATLNKDTFYQADTLLALHATGKRDRDAVRDWVEYHSGSGEIVASLPTLAKGEGWVCSPAWLETTRRVKFLPRRTFDSGATPEVGTPVEPQKRAEVDLSVLRARLHDAVERAKADDPAELRRAIAVLRKDLAAAKAVVPAPAAPVVERIEVPVFDRALAGRLAGLADAARVALDQTVRDLQQIGEAILAARDAAPVPIARAQGKNGPLSLVPPPPPASRVSQTVSVLRPPMRDENGNRDGGALGKGERTVLGVLTEYPEGRTYDQTAFLAGYSVKASTMGVILANLRRMGLVEPGNQPIRLTTAGLAAAGGARPRPTGAALLEQWMRHPRMGGGERKVLAVLIDAYPNAMTNEALCEASGYSTNASTIGVILAKLRKLGLVETGWRRVADDFMAAIQAGDGRA